MRRCFVLAIQVRIEMRQCANSSIVLDRDRRRRQSAEGAKNGTIRRAAAKTAAECQDSHARVLSSTTGVTPAAVGRAVRSLHLTLDSVAGAGHDRRGIAGALSGRLRLSR